jgi:hypothetical protein
MGKKLVVDSYTMPLDAELAKAYLESFEIKVSLDGDVLAGAAFALGPMLGGIRLFVEPKDAERARALLKSYHDALRVPGVQNYESAEELAARAFRTSLLGLFLFPGVLHVYAITLLLKVQSRALSTKGRWRYAAAWAISGLILSAAAAYFVKLLS